MQDEISYITVIAALENAEDYQAFEAAVAADYHAESAVERDLVLRVASVLWRLRRATSVETALFEAVIDEPRTVKHSYSRPTLVGTTDLSLQKRLAAAAEQSDAAMENEPNYDANEEIEGCFYAWPHCQLAQWIASTAMNICFGAKPASLCLRWSCCSAASERQVAHCLHSRPGKWTSTKFISPIGWSLEPQLFREALAWRANPESLFTDRGYGFLVRLHRVPRLGGRPPKRP